jgi:TRAP-type C4-dicarboxylate transport system permease small subunit
LTTPAYVRWMDRLYLASVWVAGAAIFFMALIIPWGVFARYVLGTGAQWPEPIAILLMIVFSFIGAAAAYRANAHIGVTLLTERLPQGLRQLAGLLADLLVGSASLFVAWYGARLCILTMGQTISELPWLPVGVTYAALPLGSVVTLLFVLERRIYGLQDARPVVKQEAL